MIKARNVLKASNEDAPKYKTAEMEYKCITQSKRH